MHHHVSHQGHLGSDMTAGSNPLQIKYLGDPIAEEAISEVKHQAQAGNRLIGQSVCLGLLALDVAPVDSLHLS